MVLQSCRYKASRQMGKKGVRKLSMSRTLTNCFHQYRIVERNNLIVKNDVVLRNKGNLSFLAGKKEARRSARLLLQKCHILNSLACVNKQSHVTCNPLIGSHRLATRLVLETNKPAFLAWIRQTLPWLPWPLWLLWLLKSINLLLLLCLHWLCTCELPVVLRVKIHSTNL